MRRWAAEISTSFSDAAGAADDQHIFDLNVRLQYSDDAVVLTQALQVHRGQIQTLLTHRISICFACT